MDDEYTRFRRLSYQSYPKESESERAAFLNFIEESGANAILIEAVSLLYKTVEKPDNPMQWLRLYFHNKTPSRSEELKESEDVLKQDIIKQESKLTCLQVEAHRLEDRLLMLGLKAQHIEFRSPIVTNEEEYRRYRDIPDDLRWRIKPDPAFKATKSDVMMHVQASEEYHKRLTMASRDAGRMSQAKDEEEGRDENYDDYNQLYFASNEIPQPPPPTVEGEYSEVEGSVYEGFQGRSSAGGKASLAGRSGDPDNPEVTSYHEEDEGQPQSKPNSGDSREKVKKATLPDLGDVGVTLLEVEGKPPRSSLASKKLSLKTSSRKSVSSRKSGTVSDEGGVEEAKPQLPYTPDPMLAIMEPIDPAFWKSTFSVSTHAEDVDFDADEEDSIFYTDGDENEDEGGGGMYYVSSTGAKKQRKFRSQIIGEKAWKPDRGKSLYLDAQYELLLEEHLRFTSPQSVSKFTNRESQDDMEKAVPSTIQAELSEKSMLARDLDKSFNRRSPEGQYDFL